MIKKQYYTVKIEAQVPIKLTYKIFAETEAQALELAQKNTSQNLYSPPQIIWPQIKRLKAHVYNFGSSMIKLSKLF